MDRAFKRIENIIPASDAHGKRFIIIVTANGAGWHLYVPDTETQWLHWLHSAIDSQESRATTDNEPSVTLALPEK